MQFHLNIFLYIPFPMSPHFPFTPPPEDSLGLTAGENYDLVVSVLGAIVWCLRRCLVDHELLSLGNFEVMIISVAILTAAINLHVGDILQDICKDVIILPVSDVFQLPTYSIRLSFLAAIQTTGWGSCHQGPKRNSECGQQDICRATNGNYIFIVHLHVLHCKFNICLV